MPLILKTGQRWKYLPTTSRSSITSSVFRRMLWLTPFSTNSSKRSMRESASDLRYSKGLSPGITRRFCHTHRTFDPRELRKELLHPVLHGRDFEKWFIRSTDRRILYVNGETKIKAFPHAEQWLSQFKTDLKKRRECQNGVIPWFSLQWPRDRSLL